MRVEFAGIFCYSGGMTEYSGWDKLLISKYGAEQAHTMIAFRKMFWNVAKYTPTPLQKVVADAPRLTKLLSGGVRAGKSFTTSMLLADFLPIKNEIIWLIGGSYEAARQEFLYLHEPLMKLGLVTKTTVSMPRIGPWAMDIAGGAQVLTKSSADIKSLASVAPIAIGVVEAAGQDADVFDKAFERGLQKDGLIIFSGTLEAEAQLLFTNNLVAWERPADNDPHTPQSWSLPTWSNTHEFPQGRDDPKFKRMTEGLTPEKFNERIAAIPYRPSGLVHKRYTDDMLQPLAHDPDIPIHIAIDPGYSSYVLLFLQRHGEYVHILDEIYRHEALTHDFIEEAMAHELWEHVTWGVIDIASKQRQAQDSVHEVWRRVTGLSLVTRRVSVQDGIDAIETRCMPGEDGSPRLLINSDMKFEVGRDGRANSLRAEFNLRRWPRYKASRADGVQPVKANDHGLNTLGYILSFYYRQEREARPQPNPVGQKRYLPSRLAGYRIPRGDKPNYAGNKTRTRALALPRRKRARL